MLHRDVLLSIISIWLPLAMSLGCRAEEEALQIEGEEVTISQSAKISYVDEQGQPLDEPRHIKELGDQWSVIIPNTECAAILAFDLPPSLAVEEGVLVSIPVKSVVAPYQLQVKPWIQVEVTTQSGERVTLTRHAIADEELLIVGVLPTVTKMDERTLRMQGLPVFAPGGPNGRIELRLSGIGDMQCFAFQANKVGIAAVTPELKRKVKAGGFVEAARLVQGFELVVAPNEDAPVNVVLQAVERVWDEYESRVFEYELAGKTLRGLFRRDEVLLRDAFLKFCNEALTTIAAGHDSGGAVKSDDAGVISLLIGDRMKATDQFRADGDGRFMLAWLKYLRAELDTAEDLVRPILQSAPEDCWAYYLSQSIHRLLGKRFPLVDEPADYAHKEIELAIDTWTIESAKRSPWKAADCGHRTLPWLYIPPLEPRVARLERRMEADRYQLRQ